MAENPFNRMKARIILKINRDDARFVQQHFFPYIRQLCSLRIRQAGTDKDDHFLCLAIKSIFDKVEREFDHRLTGFADSFKFRFAIHEAIILYRLLMAFPVENNEFNFYMDQLRQNIIRIIHGQLSEPVIVAASIV